MENIWIDKLAIHELYARYAHAIDDLDPEAWVQCFTPNGGFQVADGVVWEHPALREYGVTILRKAPKGDRSTQYAEFITDPPTPANWYRWNQATYEWVSKEVGFGEFAWNPSDVAPEDVARYGEAYGHDFRDNCIVIGLVCQE